MDYFIFECRIDCERKEIKIILSVYMPGKDTALRYETAGRESYKSPPRGIFQRRGNCKEDERNEKYE